MLGELTQKETGRQTQGLENASAGNDPMNKDPED